MPRQRVQADNAIPRARLRPIAAPVDTFVQTNAGTSTAKLADALATVAPRVGRLADVLGKQEDANEKEKGEQMARRIAESGKSFRDAIREGLITPDQSPWFRLGAKEQFGRVTADKFATDLQLAMANDPKLTESVEASDYDAFVQEFRAQWLRDNVGDEKDRDLHFENGFGPRSDAYVTDLRRQFAAQAGQRLVRVVGDQQYQEQHGVIQDGITRGLDMTAMAEGLNVTNRRAIATGLNPRVANEMTIRAVADAAMRTRNPALLDVLKQVEGGRGAFLWGTRPAQEAMREALDYIATARQRENAARRADDAERRETEERTVFTEAAGALAQSTDPHAVDMAPYIQRLAAQGNTQAIRELTALQDALAGERFETNPEVLNDTLAAIWSPNGGVTMRSLVRLLSNKQLDPRDFAFLESQIRSRDEAATGGDDGKDPNKNVQFRDGTSRLRSLFVNEFGAFDSDKQARAWRAHAEFTRNWLNFWSQGGGAASYEQRNTWITTEVERLANKYGAPNTRPADMRDIPGGPIWRKERVINRSFLHTIELQMRSPNGLSDYTVRRLQAVGIQHPEDVQEFIRAQRSLIGGSASTNR